MNGYLVMIHRTLDAEPMALFADHGEATRTARQIVAGYDPERPARGQPKKGRGELGPPGLVSRLTGTSVVTFRDGRPVPCETIRFVPEFTDRGAKEKSA